MWNINQHISLAPLSVQHIFCLFFSILISPSFVSLFTFAALGWRGRGKKLCLAPENHRNKSVGRRKAQKMKIYRFLLCSVFFSINAWPHTWMSLFWAPKRNWLKMEVVSWIFFFAWLSVKETEMKIVLNWFHAACYWRGFTQCLPNKMRECLDKAWCL